MEAALARIAKLETSLTAVTNRLLQVSSQQPIQAPAPALRPPKLDKYDGDRRSGATQATPTVNDAIRLAQAADAALYLARPTCTTSSPTHLGPQPMQLGAMTKLTPTDPPPMPAALSKTSSRPALPKTPDAAHTRAQMPEPTPWNQEQSAPQTPKTPDAAHARA